MNPIFEKAGFDEALARDADRAIGSYVLACLLIRLEQSSQPAAADFDVVFEAGLEDLLDDIETRLRDGMARSRL